MQDIATEVVTVTPTSATSLSPNELSDSTDGSYSSEIHDAKRKVTHIASINRFVVFSLLFIGEPTLISEVPLLKGKYYVENDHCCWKGRVFLFLSCLIASGGIRSTASMSVQQASFTIYQNKPNRSFPTLECIVDTFG